MQYTHTRTHLTDNLLPLRTTKNIPSSRNIIYERINKERNKS